MVRIRKKIFVLLIIILIIISNLLYILINKNDKNLMPNFVNCKYSSLEEEILKYNFDLEVKYVYDDKVLKDYIISQSILENSKINSFDKLVLEVSLGPIDYDKLKDDRINELGNVPIMMYHGIVDMLDEDTSYTLGNVDKDGYTRTSSSFRRDLDFYYENGYRMIKLSDYINGNIDVEYGMSPIVLTFDDGNENNIKVLGLDNDGNIIIDKNSAVGILEEYKKKYPDFSVTAIFFVTNNLFNQPEYDELIIKWLIDNGYEVGNHTKGHNDFTKIDEDTSEMVVGYIYDKLENIVGNKYSKIVALPYGSPYNKEHSNYNHIISGTYNDKKYNTEAILRVGWEPELSPYNKGFDKLFLKRCRAYDNNGVDFDIDMVFNKLLKNNRYISDGNLNTIVTSKDNKDKVNDTIDKELILY